MKNIEIETKPGGWISKEDSVTIKNYGHMIQVQNSSNKQQHLGNYRKQNGGKYRNIEKNEIIVSKQNKYKILENVKREVVNAKDILLNNFCGNQNVLFITLTCDEPIVDFQEIRKCFRNFYNKLRRKYGDLNYFYVIEVQKNRRDYSLHIHLAIKHTSKKRFSIPDAEIQRMWGKGFTKTKRLKNIYEITSYFFKDLLEEEALKVYKKYSHIFFCSSKLKRPEKVSCTMEEFLDKYGQDYYVESSVINNVKDVNTGKIMCSYKNQHYKIRRKKRKCTKITELIIKEKRQLGVNQICNGYIICDDIYSSKAWKIIDRGMKKIKVKVRNLEVLDKIHKGKQWFLLEFCFPRKEDLSNVEIIDVIPDEEMMEKSIFSYIRTDAEASKIRKQHD